MGLGLRSANTMLAVICYSSALAGTICVVIAALKL